MVNFRPALWQVGPGRLGRLAAQTRDRSSARSRLGLGLTRSPVPRPYGLLPSAAQLPQLPRQPQASLFSHGSRYFGQRALAGLSNSSFSDCQPELSLLFSCWLHWLALLVTLASSLFEFFSNFSSFINNNIMVL